MNDVLDDLSNVKKMEDANNDIQKINNAVRSNYAVQHSANYLYHNLISKLDYIPYIDAFKVKYNMRGDLPLERLGDEGKKKVL